MIKKQKRKQNKENRFVSYLEEFRRKEIYFFQEKSKGHQKNERHDCVQCKKKNIEHI